MSPPFSLPPTPTYEAPLTPHPAHRLLHAHLVLPLASPPLLPTALRTIRAALFPLNAPAPPTPPPSAAEALGLRRAAAEGLLGLLPRWVGGVYFGRTKDAGTEGEGTEGEGTEGGGTEGERQVREVEELLDVFADPYLNRHLLYALVDLVVVRVLPEMAERGVGELRGERVGAGA